MSDSCALFSVLSDLPGRLRVSVICDMAEDGDYVVTSDEWYVTTDDGRAAADRLRDL